MGLTAERLREGLDDLAARDPLIASEIARIGYPPPRGRPPGYATLLRTILGQQVSFKAADAMWRKLEGIVGDPGDPRALLAMSPEQFRAAGFSRQKMGYAIGLAEAAASGRIDFTALPTDEDAAVATLTGLKGIGRWSAEVYLLFSEGRPDIFPAGDLAVQIELGRLLGLPERPSEKTARALAERWQPWRGVMAAFLWHRNASPPI